MSYLNTKTINFTSKQQMKNSSLEMRKIMNTSIQPIIQNYKSNYDIFVDENPISNKINSSEKIKLNYYYKNRKFKYDLNFIQIKNNFSLFFDKLILVKSINTLQKLMRNQGYIYPRVINTIKNKLYFWSLFMHNKNLSKECISHFIDKVVQLSRYQHTYFRYPKKTNSIEMLLRFINPEEYINETFSGCEIINCDLPLEHLEMENFELRHLIHIPYDRNSIINEIKNEHKFFQQIKNKYLNIIPDQIIQKWNEPTLFQSKLYSKINNNISIHQFIQNEIDSTKIQYSEILNNIKSYLNPSELIYNIEIDLQIPINDILKIQIEFVDHMSSENILLNINENDTFIFIGYKAKNKLYLIPFTSENFYSSINYYGFYEPTTGIPIIFDRMQISITTPYPENCWFIFNKNLFMRYFYYNG